MTTRHPLDEAFSLDTARCRLRQVSRADIPWVFSASRVPGFNDGLRWDPPAEACELEAALVANLAAWRAGEAYALTVDKRPQGEPIGRVVLGRSDAADGWWLGFWTHPDFQQQGFQREVLPAVLRLGFEGLGAQRIEASCAHWNQVSARLLEKIGMQFVDRDEQGLFKRGEWVAVLCYSIDCDRWRRSVSQDV